MGDVLTGRQKPSILVVDDHPQNVMVMTELLSTRGYRLLSAHDAATAEIEIRRDPPDLILLDVIMPGKTGYELCRQLKDDPLTRLIPVVMITGLTAREDRLKGIEAGADDFLSKPINPEELFARVSSLLKLKEFTDELETAESVICTLGLSVESRDPYTEGHCERLAQNAAAIAEKELAWARGEVPAIAARVAADQAKYATPPDPNQGRGLAPSRPQARIPARGPATSAGAPPARRSPGGGCPLY